MQIDIINLDVDGSLSNPFVLAAVVIWTLVMSAMVALATRAWLSVHPRMRHSSGLRVALAAAVLVLFVSTPVVQFLIANVIYRINTMLRGGPMIVSVGFYGGPPVWPAWVGAALAAGGILWSSRLSRPRTRGSGVHGAAQQRDEADGVGAGRSQLILVLGGL
jgi:hypothetical protein